MNVLSNTNKISRIFGFDFAKCICALLIIFYHYACHTISEFRFFYYTANGYSWGGMLNTVFFAVSGASLYYKYQSFSSWHSVKVFWYKRWKSLFPMFYICFLFFFTISAISNHKLFFGPAPSTLILSVFGIDGYCLNYFPTYYQVGERFIGAIIFLYIIYPLLLFLMNKCRYCIPVTLFIGYLIMTQTSFFTITPSFNLISCTGSFYAGILFMKHFDSVFNNKTLCIVSVIVFLLLLTVKLPIDGRYKVVIFQLHGLSLLLVTYHLGEYLKNTKSQVFFTFLSKLTYPIFLIHHQVILRILKVYDPINPFLEFCMIFAVTAITVVCAKLLSIITNKLLKSKFFVKLENKLIIKS